MTTAQQPRIVTPRDCENGQQWLESLGNVPMARIVFNPWPGTATEADMLELLERQRRPCELVDGTLVEKTVGLEESLIAKAILFALETFAKPRKLGIVGGPDSTLRMITGRIRLPDVVFISVQDLPNGKRPRVKVPKLPPTLAVEVLSEDKSEAEMQMKKEEYFSSGARMVWLVDPRKKCVRVYDRSHREIGTLLTGNDVVRGTEMLADFSMTLEDIFHISDFEED